MSSTGAVLLVGGTGFIGRALAERLIAEGCEVHVLGRRTAPCLTDGVIAHRGDQGNIELIRPLLERCSAVVHLAGATIPADTVWQPVSEAESGLLPALRFLECAQAFPDMRYLLVSSGGALYGNADFASENSALVPSSYYGAGKLALESFFRVFGQRHPDCLTILRPANVYGPGQALRPGFGVIRTLLERARDGGKVVVYGDGSAVRDYLFIDDMVAACLAALAGAAGIYNVGAGVGVTLLTLIDVVEQVTGRHLDIEFRSARASDVARVVLDIGQARASLGWSPRVALNEGVMRTWRSLS